jgi:hypothetical protein
MDQTSPAQRGDRLPGDRQLIAAMAAGDDGALRELCARHAPWLAARLPADRRAVLVRLLPALHRDPSDVGLPHVLEHGPWPYDHRLRPAGCRHGSLDRIAGRQAGHRRLIPLVIETGPAVVISVTTYGPFREPERATGRWLPWLRWP